jgi:hypothetical protein
MPPAAPGHAQPDRAIRQSQSGVQRQAALPGGAGTSRERPRNIAASVADRLLQRARQTGEEHQLLLMQGSSPSRS